MAQYGYSAGYQGGGPSSVPSGYIEAYAQAGRNIGQGIQSIGNVIGESLQRYGQNKAENEFLTSRLESLAPYLQTVAQSGNIMDKNTPESKLLGDIEKFSSMSIPQKKATLLNAEFYLDRADKQRARELTDEAARQQLQLGGIQLQQAQREAAAAPYFTQALGEVMSRPQGQGPTAPYANVTSELISKYGDKLTPAQMQSLIPMIRRSEQTIPAGLIPKESKVGPGGIETTYSAAPTIGSTPIPGTRMVQPTVGGTPFGAPVKAERSDAAAKAYDDLPESLQKFADKFAADFQNDPTVKNMNVAGSFLNQMETISKDVGTNRYRPSDDMALVFAFMKTLDPGSTVREGEYASARNTTGVPGYVINAYNQALDGKFLNDAQRKSFVETARKNYSGISKQAEDVAKSFKQMAKDRNVPENLVVPEGMFQRGKETTAAQMPRIQSVEQAESTLKPGEKAMVLNPATGKYQEYLKQ